MFLKNFFWDKEILATKDNHLYDNPMPWSLSNGTSYAQEAQT